VVFVSESESAGFLFYCRFYICITVGDTVIKRERLGCHLPVEPHYILVIVLRQDTNFQPNISWLFFVFNDLMLDVVVRILFIFLCAFVGIVDHHHSNCNFIILAFLILIVDKT